MRVLVGCEFSGVVRDAFTKRGHTAMSCDLLPSETKGLHCQGDIFDVLSSPWDLIIMHPPCTALTISGNAWYGEGMAKYSDRLSSCQWTKKLWDKSIEVSTKVCFENPVGILQRLAAFPKPHYIQPYQFGHLEQKKTGLFLWNLPPLKETNNVYEEMMRLPKKDRQRLHYLSASPDRANLRSITFTGIAEAMAQQWG